MALLPPAHTSTQHRFHGLHTWFCGFPWDCILMGINYGIHPPAICYCGTGVHSISKSGRLWASILKSQWSLWNYICLPEKNLYMKFTVHYLASLMHVWLHTSSVLSQMVIPLLNALLLWFHYFFFINLPQLLTIHIFFIITWRFFSLLNVSLNFYWANGLTSESLSLQRFPR